ncbi:MAG: flippase-like domain-containing protein [Calditrichaeota bacterium]|nr:flippase-like domain-containing protein [Calditrichota bacterium]
MKRGRIALGLGVSLFFVYLTLYAPDIGNLLHGRCSLSAALFGHPRLDFSQVWRSISGVRLLPLLLAFLINPLHLYIRGHRWSVLVQPSGRLRAIDSFGFHLIGYLANAVLPLKAGEIARIMLLAERLKISRSTALATVILERMVDLLSLLFILGLVYFIFPIPQRFTEAALVVGIFSTIAFAILAYFGIARKPFSGWLGRLFGRKLFGRRLRRFLTRFIEGFAALRSTHHLGIVLFETIGLYILYTMQMYLMLLSFNFTSEYPLIVISPIVASIVLLVIDSIAIAVPSAPSAVGTFHAIAIFGLSLFDVPTDPAAGFVIVQHALGVVFSLVFGLAAMWREGVKISELKNLPQ